MQYSTMDSALQGFDFYWKSWHVVENWRQRHHAAMVAAHRAQNNIYSLHNFQNSLPFGANHFNTGTEEEEENGEIFDDSGNVDFDEANVGLPGNQYINEFHYSSVYDDSTYDDDDDDEDEDDDDNDDDDNDDDDDNEMELEFVVNDEMIAFIEQSMKHKMELKKERELQRINELSVISEDNIEESFDKKETGYQTKKGWTGEENVPSQSVTSQFPNINNNSQKRIEEMTVLYGDAMPKICGMETALQLSFNRLRDHSKPVHWPCIPFRP